MVEEKRIRYNRVKSVPGWVLVTDYLADLGLKTELDVVKPLGSDVGNPWFSWVENTDLKSSMENYTDGR